MGPPTQHSSKHMHNFQDELDHRDQNKIVQIMGRTQTEKIIALFGLPKEDPL